MKISDAKRPRLVVPLLALFVLSVVTVVEAQTTSEWTGNSSSSWSNNSNWSPPGAPNQPTAIAIFGSSATSKNPVVDIPSPSAKFNSRPMHLTTQSELAL